MLCCAVLCMPHDDSKTLLTLLAETKDLRHERTDSLSTAAISRISAKPLRNRIPSTGCNDLARLSQAAYQPLEGGGGGGSNADAFGHVYFLITKARRTISPTTTTATATKDGFNVNYAMLPLPLTLTLPQGSRQRDTRWQFAFIYCPPFPMRCLCLALTTKFACHVAKFRRAKKVKSAAWKVGKR